MRQGDKGLGENTFKRGKLVGESKTPILAELNPPKNRRIPWWNQEITNGETWRALTVVLEKRRVKSVKG
jgi:hypothetical protein